MRISINKLCVGKGFGGCNGIVNCSTRPLYSLQADVTFYDNWQMLTTRLTF